jgi:hypothetical protein
MKNFVRRPAAAARFLFLCVGSQLTYSGVQGTNNGFMHCVAPSENDTAAALEKRFLVRVSGAHSIFREMPVVLKPAQVETAAELDTWLPYLIGEW